VGITQPMSNTAEDYYLITLELFCKCCGGRLRAILPQENTGKRLERREN
jgi:hypothetical protein